MKVTWSWLADWVDLPSTAQELAHALAMRGFPVASIERAVSLDPSIVVGKVLDVKPHPNADRLRLCEVDIGATRLSIVCGAANVAAGQSVAVAQVGARLPDGTKLRRSKIRGVESEGMICSERELGLSEEAQGIWVLSDSPRLGAPVQDLLGAGDTVLDVEVTPNRTDCLSVRGLAREIASIHGAKVRPVPAVGAAIPGTLPRVSIEDPRDCLRYMARVVRDVRIGPSPQWLCRRLEAAGFRSINNVVDVTNYVLRTHGQPIHAFDASKVGGNEIVVRRARAGERLTLLDGRDVTLGPGVLVIADRSRPMALAGIMGGLDSGVTGGTNTVVLESAHFSSRLTLEAARSLGLETDASQRFGQGVDPDGVAHALDEAARLLGEVASGSIVEGVVDLWPGREPRTRVRLRRSRLVRLLGMEIDPGRVEKSLESLEIQPVEGADAATDEVLYEIPPYRKDLEIEEDLIEEVARVEGYDRIPSRIRSHTLSTVGERAQGDVVRYVIRVACGFGFDESLNTVLVGDVPREALPESDGSALWELRNPKSRELKHLRASLLPGLLMSVARNLRHGAHEVRLIEAGKVFRASPPPLGTEWTEIGLVLSGTPDPWIQPGAGEDRYLELKGVVESVLEALGIDSRTSAPYHDSRWVEGTGASIEVRGTKLARLGQITTKLAAATGLERPAWAAVLDFDAIVALIPANRQFRSLPKFPALKRDLALVVRRDVTHARAVETIRRAGGALLESVRLFDVFEGDQLGSGNKSLAYALEFRAPDRTLQDREVDEAVRSIVRALSADLGATLRGGESAAVGPASR